MRIVLACQSYPPMISGAALVAGRLAEGLAQRGHQVLVLAASDRGPAYQAEDRGVHLIRLASFPNPFRVGQRFTLWPGRAVQTALRAFRADVVHAHDPLGVGLAVLREAWRRQIPTALTLHQLPWFISASLPAWSLPLARPLEAAAWGQFRWLGRRVSRLVTPSAAIAAIVRAHGAGDPLAISNGVDLERFQPAPQAPNEAAALCRRYGLDPGRPVILHVGRLDADKRVDVVLRAAAHAVKLVEAQVVVVGDGRQRPALEALSRALALPARFTGFVSAGGDLPALYRLAAVFITASEVEIQSSVTLEAAAAGRPVVAVRASSMAEFVQDGSTGYLAAPGSAEELGGRLAELLRDPQRAQAMGRAGRALAERHPPQASLAEHEALYQTLMAAA